MASVLSFRDASGDGLQFRGIDMLVIDETGQQTLCRTTKEAAQ